MDMQQQQINVELGEKEAEGIYSNLALISHSPAEFVMDFTKILPGVTKARVHSRVIMAPQHTKAFLAALNDNIKRYEQKNGEIAPPAQEGFGDYPAAPPEGSLPN